MTRVGGYWREAATLVIASKSTPGAGATGSQVMDKNNIQRQLIPCDYNIVMLKRSAKSKFMPDITVFPGGVISNADFSPNWIELLNKYKGPFANTVQQLKKRKAVPFMFRNRPWSKLPAEIAFRICAIRECFEESGILIVRRETDDNTCKLEHPLTSRDLNSNLWRKRVHNDPGQFFVMCVENGLVPDIWSLYEWSNWLTPVIKQVDKAPSKPHRFDTVFYVCCVSSVPDVRVDRRETVDTQLQSPFELVHLHHTGKIELRGPQFYELSRLDNFTTLTSLHDYITWREVQGLERWMPVVTLCGDGYISLLPGDDLYPENPDYEGKNGVITSDNTVGHLRDISVRQNRSERGPDGKVTMYTLKNMTLACEQVPPVEQVYLPTGKV